MYTSLSLYVLIFVISHSKMYCLGSGVQVHGSHGKMYPGRSDPGPAQTHL